jgi:hypothetical protein
MLRKARNWLVPRSIGAGAQAQFERLVLRTSAGRTEFFEPDEFPWIADVEARADEINEELDRLLAHVDQLPNFQDIQEDASSPRTTAGRSFPSTRTGPARTITAGSARAPLRLSSRSPA